MRHLLILLPLFASAACQEKKPDWAKEGAAGAALAPQVCAKVKQGLESLAKGGFDYTDKGEATLPVETWGQMAPQQRDQLANTLAFQASCASGATSDAQSVAIRGDDGSVLMRRTVSTRVGMGELLGGD